MSCRSSHPRSCLPALLGAAAAALVLFGASVPAQADGMEPQPAPPAQPRTVRPAQHHHRHHARVHRHVRGPVIGSIVKHVHDGYDTPVYAMPAWPECRFWLDTAVVRLPSDNNPGYWACN